MDRKTQHDITKKLKVLNYAKETGNIAVLLRIPRIQPPPRLPSGLQRLRSTRRDEALAHQRAP